VFAQPYKWSLQYQTEAAQHFPDEDTADDYSLMGAKAEVFAAFVQGPVFSTLLTAMDNNKERIHQRKKNLLEREKFLEDKEDEAKTATMDKAKVGEDELAAYPPMPLPPSDWIYLIRQSNPQGVVWDADISFALMTAITDLAGYCHKLQWQVDTLQQTLNRHVEGCASAGTGGSIKDDLINKYPFLAECGAHVWTIPPGQKPLQLARSAPVRTFPYSSRTQAS